MKVVDTFLESTETCADRIVAFLNNPEEWTALKNIRKELAKEPWICK